MNGLLQRIKEVSDKENITLTFLEKKIGASKGVLSRAFNKNKDIQSKWLVKIVENYPHYNCEWLLTGKGNPIKEQSKDLIETLKDNIELRKEIDHLKSLLYSSSLDKRSVG